MLTRRRLLAAAAILPLAFAIRPESARAAETATAFIQSIFDQYAHPDGGIVLDKPEDVRRWFDTDLADHMIEDAAQATEAGDVPSLDGDPFVDAQDFEIKDVRITVDNETADDAKVAASFTNFGDAKTIRYDLVMTGSGWRIHDIEWPEGTLRGMFSH